uniref:Pyrroloquinoline quinone-dependent pyranose dehydrogenase beta-propeller domain-containing protein n=1 Tax=Strigamia maritima TaxID=126957 RepID=T1JJG4_STRMM
MIFLPDMLPQNFQPATTQTDTNDEKPITRENLMLRCVFSFVLIIFLAIVGAIVVLMSPLTPIEPFNTNLEWSALEVPNDLSSRVPFHIPRQLKIPKGFGIEVYAQVPSARFLLTLPDNVILVSQPKLGLVSLLRPSTSFHSPATHQTFISNLNLPQDMVYHTEKNGTQYIYIAESTRVARYLYRKGQKKLRFPEVIVDDLPYFDGYLHPYKGIAIGNGSLYVSIGSSSDTNAKDLLSEPKRGAIYAYRLSDGQRRLVSSGIRHAEGLAFQPATGNLWAVSGQRTDIKYPFKDENYGEFVEDFALNNPVDEFMQIVEGENFGWPYCNPLHSFILPVQYAPDVENNPSEVIYNCSDFRKVDLDLPSHSVPLGLTFWSGQNVPNHYNGIAVVALHDNRKDGHKVIHVPWNPLKRPQFFKELVVGWASESDEIRWGQPVDTAVMQDGSLLISEDLHGVIYRLYKKT